MQFFGQIEVKMNLIVTGDGFMDRFVSGEDLLQEREVVSAVNFPVLLIPVLTRRSMPIFVSFTSYAIANTLLSTYVL